VDVVALGDVLGSLDNAHGELVYSKLFLRYIQTGVFEQIDAGKAKKYRKLCFCFFKITGFTSFLIQKNALSRIVLLA